MRASLVGLFAWVALVAPTGAVAAERESPHAAAACIPAEKCCKVCDDGQACGNTCISRKKQCHKGRGCACDAAEVCASP